MVPSVPIYHHHPSLETALLFHLFWASQRPEHSAFISVGSYSTLPFPPPACPLCPVPVPPPAPRTRLSLAISEERSGQTEGPLSTPWGDVTQLFRLEHQV